MLKIGFSLSDGRPLSRGETLKALYALREQGKIRYIGCSNYSGWHIRKALDAHAHRGRAIQVECRQPAYIYPYWHQHSFAADRLSSADRALHASFDDLGMVQAV